MVRSTAPWAGAAGPLGDGQGSGLEYFCTAR